MKTNNMMLLVLLVLLLPIASTSSSTTLTNPNLTTDQIPGISWGIDEGVSLIYNATSIAYNTTDDPYIPINNEFGDDIGQISEGDYLQFRMRLTDLLDDQEDIYHRITGSNLETEIEEDYRWNETAWPPTQDAGGPVFLYPVIPVFQDWNEYISDWISTSPTYDMGANTLTISTSNLQFNISTLDIVWDTTTGVLKSYTFEGTESDGTPLFIQLQFQYFRDETQWDLSFGVQPGNLAMFQFTKIMNDTGDTLEFISETDEYNNEITYYVSEGDNLLFNFKEFSTIGTDQQLGWNASLKTLDWETQLNYQYQSINQLDGPATYLPVIPIGNDLFYNNITDEFEALGATVSRTSTILNVTITSSVANETARWDLTTGLLEELKISFQEENDGVSHLVEAQLELQYFLPVGEEVLFANDFFEERYVMNQAVNGSQDYLNLGGSEDPFVLYTGDVLQVRLEQGSFAPMLNDHESDQPRWSIRTNSGYQTAFFMQPQEPGFEIGNDGPPGLNFAIPIGTTGYTGQAWWDLIADTYASVGYGVEETSTYFGIIIDSEFDVEAQWSKTDGVLEYYHVNGTDDGGNTVVWEMTRGSNIRDPTGLSWGVAAGTTLNYTFSDVSPGLPFGESETALIESGDTIQVTFAELSDFENGPQIYVDFSFEGETETNNSVGLQNPGFEFVSFEEEGNNFDGPPLLYFALPVGDATFYETVRDMFLQPGYAVVNNATHFGVTIIDPSIAGDVLDLEVEAVWQKSDGLLVYYSFSGELNNEGDIQTFTITLGTAVVVTPPTTTPITSTPITSGAPSLLPAGNTFLIALPFAAIVVGIIRRKSKI